MVFSSLNSRIMLALSLRDKLCESQRRSQVSHSGSTTVVIFSDFFLDRLIWSKLKSLFE